jgi:acyl carrier protein
MTMETTLAEIGMKSIQLISVSALLEEKLGDAPSFRALMNMEKIKDIRDFILQ